MITVEFTNAETIALVRAAGFWDALVTNALKDHPDVDHESGVPALESAHMRLVVAMVAAGVTL